MSARPIALWLIFCVGLPQLVCPPLATSSEGPTIPQFAAQSASRSSYFIDAAGSLYVWGQNTHGQLGNGNTNNQLAPIRIPFPDGVTAWKSVAAGERHAMAIANNDQLYVWGDNTHGQLGIITINTNPPAIARPESVSLPNGAVGWKAIAAGGLHSLAVDSNDRLYAWGYNQVRPTGHWFQNKPFHTFANRWLDRGLARCSHQSGNSQRYKASRKFPSRNCHYCSTERIRFQSAGEHRYLGPRDSQERRYVLLRDLRRTSETCFCFVCL